MALGCQASGLLLGNYFFGISIIYPNGIARGGHRVQTTVCARAQLYYHHRGTVTVLIVSSIRYGPTLPRPGRTTIKVFKFGEKPSSELQRPFKVQIGKVLAIIIINNYY